MSVVDNEKFMKEIIDNMETLVRVVDDNHNTIYMNKKMEEVFENLIDCPCMSIMERITTEIHLNKDRDKQQKAEILYTFSTLNTHGVTYKDNRIEKSPDRALSL